MSLFNATVLRSYQLYLRIRVYLQRRRYSEYPRGVQNRTGYWKDAFAVPSCHSSKQTLSEWEALCGLRVGGTLSYQVGIQGFSLDPRYPRSDHGVPWIPNNKGRDAHMYRSHQIRQWTRSESYLTQGIPSHPCLSKKSGGESPRHSVDQGLSTSP